MNGVNGRILVDALSHRAEIYPIPGGALGAGLGDLMGGLLPVERYGAAAAHAEPHFAFQ
jgi:hypothetical protein